MADIIIIAVLACLVGGALLYVKKSKKQCPTCIGCPNAKECSGCCGVATVEES